MGTQSRAGNSLTEDVIVKRRALFEQYVQPNLNMIYHLCIQYSSSQEDIEDNYVEVLANFYKYIETYDPKKSIQTWLHIVTKRFVFIADNKRNAFKRSDDVSVEKMSGDLLWENNGSNCMGMDNYHLYYSDDILKALKQLKPIYREALLLQQAGYRLDEIAEISYQKGEMKSPNVETVKSRLFLAKQKMRELINRDGEKRVN